MVLINKMILTKVLFICLGNINRSPAAELIWKRIVHKRVQSAGFIAPGRSISKKMRDVLIGVSKISEKEILNHRSKVVSLEMVEWATVIFCMTPYHMRKLVKIFPNCRVKIELLPKFINKERISDPGFSSNISDFEESVWAIEKAIYFINRKIKQGV